MEQPIVTMAVPIGIDPPQCEHVHPIFLAQLSKKTVRKSINQNLEDIVLFALQFPFYTTEKLVCAYRLL